MRQHELIKAIETRYAGCRFRSRLEARWAVFFDALGIRWEYEPEGVVCSHRITAPHLDKTFPYLPDFRLPDLGLWVEVKGSLTDEECLRLFDAAAHLSAPGGGCGDGDNTLVLGPISITGPLYGFLNPESHNDFYTWGLPWSLHMHKGSLIAGCWEGPGTGTGCLAGNFMGGQLAADYGGSLANVTQNADFGGSIPRHVLGGPRAFGRAADSPYLRALMKARSARFEHGETPAASLEGLISDRLSADAVFAPYFGETTTACTCMTWQQCDRCAV